MNNTVAESILNAERRLVKSRQVLSINIQEDNVEAANDLLLQQRAARYSKRPLAQTETELAKKKKVFPDTISIAGLKGTLGANLGRLGDITLSDCAENRYIKCLSKNGIMDITLSSSNSQIAHLGGSNTMNFMAKKFSYISPDLNSEEINQTLNNKIKKLRERNIAEIYSYIDLCTTRSPKERAIKDIYRHIIQQHAFKGHMLSDQYFLKCSETSLISKYWGPIFEAYFGESRHMFIQWGDTISIDCKNEELKCRLDLRIITDTEQGHIEATTGEFASTKATINGKLHKDKLKSVLVSKCHLNSLLKKLLYLPQNQVSKVYIPILQIMGQNISLYAFSLIDKQVYTVQDIMDAEYPRTLVGVRKGGINKIINLLEQVEYMIEEIEEHTKSYSRNTSNKMKDILGKSKHIRQFETEKWTSSVIWDPRVLDNE